MTTSLSATRVARMSSRDNIPVPANHVDLILFYAIIQMKFISFQELKIQLLF